MLGFPLLIVALVASAIVFRHELLAIFRDRDALSAWIGARGAWGVLAFVGLQVAQVVVFVIPGEIVQVAGGYVYGLWYGTLLSVLGITIGSLINFYLGRLLGRPFVEALFDRERIESIERVTASGKAAAGFFLLFIIPGIPKDALCYIAGVSGLGFPAFFGISMFGRLPGILGSSFMGSAAHDRSFASAIVVLSVAAVLFCIGLFFKSRIESILVRLLHGGRRK
ncbi:MAG TPA: TVP38/TMEM64 family protein [Rectinemataceae bacterium]|nr:TVP38/TMEM64 family protein [Rectinemataceae bacterium]